MPSALFPGVRVFDSIDINIIVAFGGVLLLGLIGFLYAWFAPPEKDSKSPPKST